MKTNGSGITVTGLEVSEFHRIRAAEAKLIPGSGLVRITGKNGAGKTSLLRSIRAALGGAGEVLPSAIGEGSEDGTGRVVLQLSNGFTVARRFTEANPKGYLTVVGPDGGKHAQGKLAEWLGPLSFDPLAFFELRPERQREILLSLGTDPELPTKLADVRAEHAKTYEERTPWISQQRRAKQVAKPDGERPEPVDTSAEMERLAVLQRQERERGDAIRRDERMAEQASEWGRTAERARNRVEELEKLLAEARKKLEVVSDEWDKAVRAAKDAGRAAEKLPDPSEEMGAVMARLEAASTVDEELEPWKQHDRAQKELQEAEEKVEELTAALGALEQREKALIAQAGIPVEGLTFGDDGAPLLNGRPLVIASGAERISMSVAVALAANPELRVCLVDEANDMDLEGLKELDRLAKEHGFQVWAARIGLEGAGELVVEDGEAWAPAERETVEASAP